MYKLGFYSKRGFWLSSKFYSYDEASRIRFDGQAEFLLCSNGQLEFKF